VEFPVVSRSPHHQDLLHINISQPMYNSILVPVDGSATSNHGLLEAIKLGKTMSAKLRLVHVVDTFIIDGITNRRLCSQAVVNDLRSVGRKVLEDSESLVRQHDLESSSALLEAVGQRVADLVVSEANNWGADLIVMGTHGHRGIRRLVLGSDAEMVLRTTSNPDGTRSRATAGRASS
jgi:nucleotide-binding universal stress UspA family protein